ncbi:COX assembly mitochondrial protein 2 homolog [Glandiceps talaboti]
MHGDLSSHLHTEECNELIKQLQQCHQENPWKKFTGICNELDTAMIKCLRRERENKRHVNAQKAKEMKEKLARKQQQEQEQQQQQQQQQQL